VEKSKQLTPSRQVAKARKVNLSVFLAGLAHFAPLRDTVSFLHGFFTPYHSVAPSLAGKGSSGELHSASFFRRIGSKS